MLGSCKTLTSQMYVSFAAVMFWENQSITVDEYPSSHTLYTLHPERPFCKLNDSKTVGQCFLTA